MDLELAEGILLGVPGHQLRRKHPHRTIRTNYVTQNERHWQHLSSIFYYKRPITLEYEAKKLVEEFMVKSGWTPAED